MMQQAVKSDSSTRRVQGKAGRLVQLLERELRGGKFAAGDRFLSVHQIARTYEVAPGTAHKALGELVERGYLESSRRSGFFLREGTAKLLRSRSADIPVPATTTAVVMIVGSPGQWGDRLLGRYASAVEKACRRRGWQLLRVHNRAEEIERATKGVFVAGCLAYGLHEPPAGHIDPASIINWGGVWQHPSNALLTVDSENGTRQAVEHLADLGHLHMAMAFEGGEPDGPMDEGSVLGMRKAYAALGLQWSRENLHTVRHDDMEGLYDRLCGRGVTGAIVSDWRVALGLYRQAHHRGEQIGDRLSIVASGGHDLADLVQPRPARIYWRFVDYAEIVANAMEGYMQREYLPRRLVIPTYLEKGPGARAPHDGSSSNIHS